ncbi:hypothetical protein [Hominenteromicrobium sp.]|uniref:hypothetical protein n=1 Tax=Hominenteromicrobium sp. TaxID=3073581 RepID=UPI00399A1F6F
MTQNAEAYITAPDPEQNYRIAVPACLGRKPMAEAFAENLCPPGGLLPEGAWRSVSTPPSAQASVLMPFARQVPADAGGRHGRASMPVLTGETDDATAMSLRLYSRLLPASRPFHGAAYAVVESLSKLAAVGADPMKSRLTFQEYFERLHDKPERWGKPAAALLGALTAQLNLGLPSIGGKDSMSGSFEDLDVPPTLVSFAVTMTKASKTISGAFKNAGSYAVLLPIPEDKETELPNWEALKAYYKNVLAKIVGRLCILPHSVVQGRRRGCCRVRGWRSATSLGFAFETTAENAELLFAPRMRFASWRKLPTADALDELSSTSRCCSATYRYGKDCSSNGRAPDSTTLIRDAGCGTLERSSANKAETVAVERDSAAR